jgi:3-hydroxyacyl-CoA dehydrogenase
MHPIRRAAVLGAGTMGARIAAHFANAGIPALLLDLTPELARKGLESAYKQSPSAFYSEAGLGLVDTGSFDGDLARISGCDWVVEAVAEDLEVKRSLWQRVLREASEHALLSTNTSGIPLRSICADWPAEAKSRFLGTHFFNPPRYMYLLELVPAGDAELLKEVGEFAEKVLGKGVVICRDTPNFIANRVGGFFGATVCKLMQRLDLSIEEVDALTGPLIGLPKSASFRLLDVVGLDVWRSVAKNVYDLAPDDPQRERFELPTFLTEMLARGWLGEKTGQGFYQRRGAAKEIWAIDWKTLEYHPAQKPKIGAVEQALMIEDLGERLKRLASDGSKAGEFIRTLYRDTYDYCEAVCPRIAYSPHDIDRAMEWGYGHAMGPYRVAEILGFAKSAMPPAPPLPRGYLKLGELPMVRSNAGAALRDLGDGCLCLEFRSKLNVLGQDQLEMVHTALAELEKRFEALVIANEGEHFSAGANLMMILMMAQAGDWDELSEAVVRFQSMNMALKYSQKPVVSAPHHMTLGGGCEVALHTSRMQALAEIYTGLVEAGVGVVPAGGGCKELLLKLGDARRAFELIGMAKLSTSAANAKEMGLLEKADGVTMNRRRLVGDAKGMALAMASSYRPPVCSEIRVGGDPAYAELRMMAWLMRQAEQISDHDLLIAEKLARILTGGAHPCARAVSEQHLLDLEREAFLSLCGTTKTQDRIAHMLKSGKPLRN